MEDEIAFGPENKGLPVQTINRLIHEYVGYVHMEKFLNRAPQALSGGQQQSVAYAAVLAMEPDIYVLDEPTSNLDPLGSDLVFGLVKQLATDRKKTVLIVEHKLEKVIDMVDRIIVMDKGKIAYDGTPDEVLCYYEELKRIGVVAPQVNQLFTWLNANRGTGFRQTTNLQSAVEILKNALPPDLPVTGLQKTGQSFKTFRKFTEPVIQVKDLHFGYQPGVEVLHGITLDIHRGEFVSIVAENGSGIKLRG